MRIPVTGTIRRTLYLGMGLALAVGLGVFLFFSFYTTDQVRSILRRDLAGLSSLAARSLAREHAAVTKLARDLAESKALQIILQLDMPPQAALFLEANARPGPFTRLWVLRPGGSTFSVFPPDAGSPPLKPGGPQDAFLLADAGLSLAVLIPVKAGGQTLGHLAALAPFPDQTLIESFSRPGDTGMALWLGDTPMAASSWLPATGYAAGAPPDGRTSLDLAWGGETHQFLAHGEALPLAPPTILRLEMVRSLAHAQEPFRHLLAAFFAGWVLILASFLAFARYVNVRLVKPVLHLSRVAGSVEAHSTLPAEMRGWRDAPAGNEISVLHRAFARTVTSLHRALAKAEAADRAKSDFLSTVSHELRTPLTSILGFAKIVRRRVEERIAPALAGGTDSKALDAAGQARENLDIILAEAGHLDALISNVLDFTRLEAGTMAWDMAEVDVPALVEEAAAGFGGPLRSKGLECIVRVEPGLPRIPGDRERLAQVLGNLLSNAVKFTSAGAVEVRAARDGDAVRLTVADTGPGIPEAERERIFDTFHQSGETLTGKPKGAGLGLAVSRLIVERHGGRIWAEARPGRGSAVHVLLPATGRESRS
ncbi:MAG: HAMP domain-containing sensor histidine kinase [Thermodesulfobacteriota bacterium]